MDTDRDLTDQGVKWAAAVEEREELAPDEVFERPATTPEDRAEAVASLRRDLGWGPGQAARLGVSCGCGAAAGAWCRRPGRRRQPVVGWVCAARGRSTG